MLRLRFLLTRLLRGATEHGGRNDEKLRFLLTRLLRGATLARSFRWRSRLISTHTPLARRDIAYSVTSGLNADFYSHASCEARPPRRVAAIVHEKISTHTPLARRDFHFAGVVSGFCVFLLTRLLRGATKAPSLRGILKPFLLTRLLRGATLETSAQESGQKFLLTRLLRGATSSV